MGQARQQLRRLQRGAERTRISLALSFDEDKLPTEFRIFKAGINETEKGPVLFDTLAAKLVMASYAKWGIDLPIDLEHQMADVAPGAADPTARDARGWCKLAVRNGELWAVDVHWTADGAARLTKKTQRYVSPLFNRDAKTKRVVKMFNIAITALPATHQTPALVAASANGSKMTSEDVMKALEALEAGDDEAAKEILKGIIAAAAGDGTPADGAEGDGAEGVAPPAESGEITPKVTEDAANLDPESDPDEKDEADEKKKPERKAMRVMLRALTGEKTFGAALRQVEAFRKSHVALETERTQLAADRAVLESAERRGLVTELVKLGAEFPATVWADDKATALKPRWSKMPIVELRAHVADQRTARKGKAPANVRPPPGSNETVELSATELAICKETGCDPKVFASLKAHRDGGDSAYFQSQQAREQAALAAQASSKAGN